MNTMVLAKCGDCGSVSKLFLDSNGDPHAWTACCNEKRIPEPLKDKDYETLVVLSESEYQKRKQSVPTSV